MYGSFLSPGAGTERMSAPSCLFSKSDIDSGSRGISSIALDEFDTADFRIQQQNNGDGQGSSFLDPCSDARPQRDVTHEIALFRMESRYRYSLAEKTSAKVSLPVSGEFSLFRTGRTDAIH